MCLRHLGPAHRHGRRPLLKPPMNQKFAIFDPQGNRLQQFGSFVSEQDALNVLRKAREKHPFTGCRVKPIEEKNA